MLAPAVVLLALAALPRSAPAPTRQPGVCSHLVLLREALVDMENIAVRGSARIPVHTMEKGCIHSHLTVLLSILNSLDRNIARKLEKVHDCIEHQREFRQGSDTDCATAETTESKFFVDKTSEFLTFLSQQISQPTRRVMPNS